MTIGGEIARRLPGPTPSAATVVAATAALAVRLVSAAGTIVLVLVLTRSLPIDEVGRITVGLTLAQIAAIAGRFGLENAVLRFAGGASETDRPEDFAAYAGLALRLVARTGLVVTAAVVVGILALAETEDRAHLLVLALAITAWAAIFVLSAIHKARRRVVVGAVFESGAPSLVAAVALLVIGLVSGDDLGTVTVAVVVALAFVGFAAAGIVGLGPAITGSAAVAGLDRAERRAFARTSVPFAVVATVQTLAVWGGVLVLGALADDADVAGYSVALRALSVIILYRNLVVTIASPRLAGLHQGATPERFEGATRLLGLVLIATCLPPLALVALAPEAFLGLFGREYRDFGDLVLPLAIGQVAATISAAPQAAMAMSAGEDRLQRLYLLSGAIGAGATVALTARWGPSGTAWGQALYWSVMVVATLVQYRRTRLDLDMDPSINPAIDPAVGAATDPAIDSAGPGTGDGGRAQRPGRSTATPASANNDG